MSERSAPLIYVTVKDVSGNSQRVTEQTHRVKSLVYTDNQKQADKCALKVDNFDLSNFDDPLWMQGNLVQVSWGYAGNMALTRECLIMKVKGFMELTIEARGKSVVMDAAKRSRTFKGMTRSQVVQQIAREYGYDGERLLIEDTGAKFPFITQANTTDAQLLRKLASQQGFEFYVDQDGLHFHEAKLLQPPLRSFIWYTDPGRGDVTNIDVETDVTKRPAIVTKTVRDPLTKQTTTVSASNATDTEREGTGEITLIKSPDLRTGALERSYSGGVPPAAAAQSAAPPASSAGVVRSEGAGGLEISLLKSEDLRSAALESTSVAATTAYAPVDQGPLMCSPEGGAEAAKTEAKAKFRAGQRGAVKITLEAVGDPSMLAKSIVTLSGVGQRLSGAYYVQEVEHSVAPGKYAMKLKMLSDGTGPTTRAKLGAESGLPVVAGEPSRAKKSPASVTGTPCDKDALQPVPILDKSGQQIATGWRERVPATKASKPAGGG